MSWKLTAYGATRLPLTGVPWRDMTDEEFAAAEARYPELRDRGYFAHEEATPLPRDTEVAPEVMEEAEPVEAEPAEEPVTRRGRGGRE